MKDGPDNDGDRGRFPSLFELDRLLDGVGQEMADRMEERSRRARRRRAGWVLLGSAAAVAALAFGLRAPPTPGGMHEPAPISESNLRGLAPGPGERPVTSGSEPAWPEESVTAGLEVESSRPFAVFETRDPNVTVVWLLKGD